jgi:hypothetical protein
LVQATGEEGVALAEDVDLAGIEIKGAEVNCN